MRVLITGTSSGIGKGIAEKFLKEGHNVTGIDRKDASIQHKNYTHICMDIRAKEQYPELEPFDRHYRKIRDSSGHPIGTDDRICQRTQRLGIS